jgi:predicted O-methyltransferase YrrM
MTIKQLETTLKEVKRNEKRIKLLEKLKSTVQEMAKLNGGFDLIEILAHKPQFEDDFYHEIITVIDYLKESNKLLLSDTQKAS